MASFMFGGSASSAPQTEQFTNQSAVSFSHGLGYYPSVWVKISDMFVSAEIEYTSANSITVRLASAQTGTIFYR